MGNIVVAGCGGLGSWTVFFLSKLNLTTLDLTIQVFDDDIVEDSNIARTPFTKRHLYKKKVDAIKEICDVPQIVAVPERFDEDLLLPDTKIVFDCTDNIPAQKAITSFCKNSNVEYFRVGSEKFFLSITNQTAFSYLPEEEENATGRVCGERVIQLLPTQIFAGLLCYMWYVKENKDKSIVINRIDVYEVIKNILKGGFNDIQR